VWHPSVEPTRCTTATGCWGDSSSISIRARANTTTPPSSASGRAPRGSRCPSTRSSQLPGRKADDPGLMEHSDVVTFFHEFGHLLHSILGRPGTLVRRRRTAVQRDFVEAPSQMLEEWCRDAAVLRTSRKHHQTGEAVPRTSSSGCRRPTRSDGRISTSARRSWPPSRSRCTASRPTGWTRTGSCASWSRATRDPAMPDTHMQTSFGPRRYSAILLHVLLVAVISKDMFGQFDRANLLDRDRRSATAMSCSRGGSRPARELCGNSWAGSTTSRPTTTGWRAAASPERLELASGVGFARASLECQGSPTRGVRGRPPAALPSGSRSRPPS